jgi:uncharacterized protein (PEP-CTERM system associated)
MGMPAGLDSYGGQQTADPFTRRHASLAWNIEGARTNLSIAGSWEEQDYAGLSEADETLSSFDVSLSRNLSPRLSAQINVSYSRGEFGSTGAEYDDTGFGGGLRWQFSRTLALAVTYDHWRRDDSLPVGSYRENRAWLSLSYNQGAPRRTLRSREAPRGEGG